MRVTMGTFRLHARYNLANGYDCFSPFEYSSLLDVVSDQLFFNNRCLPALGCSLHHITCCISHA